MIEVKITGRRAVCTESALLTSGSVGISIAFEFDSAWEGMSKAAVFIAGDTKIDVLMTDDICTVPWEVLEEPGPDLIVGVYGTNGDTIVMPTVYTNVGRIRHGADFDGSEGTEPTPALVDQIMAAAQNAVDTADSVREDADAGLFMGAQGPAGTDGADGVDGFSPTVAVTDIEGGHRVTITDEGGEHAFDVMDGQGGGGTGDHNQLTNRDAANQHHISAITGLQAALDGKQSGISDLATIRSGAALGATALQSVPNTYRTASAQDAIDSGKVDKVSGKGLSANDFTTAEKTKLSGIATGATAVTESTVSGWGFTKNTGTYSKPSGGIPKSDLANAVQTSLGKADSALQSHQDISGKQDKAITDAGNYFTTDTVEGALQEIGAELNNLPDIPEAENAQEIPVDSEVTAGSNNLITSGAVAAAISSAITDIDTLIGSGVIA